MPLLITISSDKENIQMTLKDRSLDQAKDIARVLWGVIENPVILLIKDIRNGKVLFKHS